MSRPQLAAMWVAGLGLAIATREHVLYALGNMAMGAAVGIWATLPTRRR